jgi:Ion channel
MSPSKPKRKELTEALQLTEPRRSFGIVLAAIVVAMIYQLAVPFGDVPRLIAIALQSTVIVLALRAAGFHRHIVRVAAALLFGLVVAVAIALLGFDQIDPAAPRLITLILIMLTPLAIVAGVVRELREDKRVTVQTIYCGLSLYLLLGLAFAFLFGAVEDISGQPFFSQGIPGTSTDFLYFSLATLTTTGYGDFSAATDLGRAMSVTEALIGQMYLVTVLAVIVSNVSRSRLR